LASKEIESDDLSDNISFTMEDALSYEKTLLSASTHKRKYLKNKQKALQQN